MIKYSPPPSTRLFVASSEIASAVGIVREWPRMISASTPQKPSVPTANPNLRKRIAPKMVEIAVKKTGASFFSYCFHNHNWGKKLRIIHPSEVKRSKMLNKRDNIYKKCNMN